MAGADLTLVRRPANQLALTAGTFAIPTDPADDALTATAGDCITTVEAPALAWTVAR